MKKEFEFPEVSIYSFLASDIITTSPFDPDGETGEGDDIPAEDIPLPTGIQ